MSRETEHKTVRSCPILLEDIPSYKDELGGHHRISEAIARLVREDPVGKSICLNGTWGSGKSTVVQLLSNSFAHDENVKILKFDSWAHQGDPLRLAFLDELHSFLREIEWQIPEESTKQLDHYRDPQKRSVTNVIPKFSWPALSFAISIPLAFLANSLLSRYGIGIDSMLQSRGVKSVDSLWAWIFHSWTIFLFFSLLPLLIVVGSFWFGKRDKQYFGLLFQRLPEQQLESGSYNPTSVHYRKLFQDIMTAVLEEKSRKFVIVLDNLDRVEPRTAFEILAIMRTFIDPDDQSEWRKKIWLLVPLDLIALQNVWTGVGASIDSANPAPEPNRTTDDTGAINDFIKSFVDKQFQTVFDVPSPLLLRWKTFLLEKLESAFEDQEISEEEFETTFHIFDLSRTPDERPLAPRDIILFINRLVSLYSIHSDFPLPVLATYALKAEDIQGILKSGKDPFGELASLADNKARRFLSRYINVDELAFYLAALHYATDLDKAKHMVLGAQLSNAILSADEETIDKYSQISGFETVLKNMLLYNLEDWRKRESGSVAKVASALAPVLRLGRLDPSIQAYLLDQAKAVETWQPFDAAVAGGITILIERSGEMGFIEHVLQSAGRSMSKREEVSSVLMIVEYLLDHQYSEIFPISTGYPEILVGLTHHPKGKNLSGRIRIEIEDLTSLCRDILQAIAAGSFAKSELDPFDLLPTESRNWPWNEFLATLRDLDKKEGSALGSFQCLVSVAIFGERELANQCKKLLGGWLNRDFISSRIANLSTENHQAGICYFEFIRIVVLDYEKVGVSGGHSAQVIRDAFRKICESLDPKAVSEFSRLAKRYHMQGRIKKIASKEGTFYKKFFEAVCRAIEAE